MVKGILRILHKDFSGLHEAALLLAISMALAQFLALARDRLLAGTFGASANLDIYYSAFRLPDLIYATIASFVSVAVLIPFLIERLEKGEEESARNFLSAVFSLFSLVMIVASTLAFIFIPWITPWLAPGFSLSAQTEMINLSRILLLSPILLGLSNMLGSVIQAYRRFFAYSLSPVLYNLGIIVGIVFLVPIWGLSGLAWGVILGAALHLAVQLPTLYRVGFWPRITIKQISTNSKLIWKMIASSWPRTLTLSTNQFVIMALIALASYLGKGAISVFNFSYNLQTVPLSIVGISYSVAAFPTLSKYFSRGHIDKFVSQIASASRHIIFWSMPATVMFIVLRAQVVRVILGTGHFDWMATRLTAACLALFAASILAQSLILLLIRGFYASGQTIKPLVANVVSSLAMIGLAVLFRGWWMSSVAFSSFWENLLRVGHLPGTIILVLPLAFSIGTLFNCLILVALFARGYDWPVRSLLFSIFKSLISAVIGGFFAYYLLTIFGNLLPLNTLVGIFLQGLLAGLGGLALNLVCLWLLKSEELAELVEATKRKFWRGEALVPEQPEL